MSKNKHKEITRPNVLAIYTRVSTNRQKNEGYSLSIQVETGKAKAKEIGWEYVLYQDAGVSGNVSWQERTGLLHLINDMNAGKIGAIYTIATDRLSRDEEYEEPQLLISMFKKAGIKLYTRNGENDYSNPGVELAARIQGVFASLERNLIKERTKAGARKSMQSGNTAGGGAVLPYGYDRQDKKLVINKDEARIVKLIFELYKKGNGTQKIAGILNDKGIPTKRNSIATGNMLVKKTIRNKDGERETIKVVKQGKEFVWRDSVIYSMLINPLYKGEKHWSDLVIPVPQIVDTETFDVVQTLLKEKSKFKKPIKNHFLLKGLVRCGKCGKSFYGHKRADLRDKAYRCLSHRYKAEWCGNRGIDIDYLDTLVWNEMLKFEDGVKDTYEWMESNEGYKVYEATRSKCEMIIKEAEKNRRSLTKKYVAEKIKEDLYNKVLIDYENEIAKAQMKLQDIESDNFLMINKKQILSIVKEFTKGMNKVETVEDKEGYIRAFVDKVVIMSGETAKSDYYQNVIIYYKLDQFTQCYLKGEVDIMYKKNWQRIGSESKALKVMITQDVKNRNESFGEPLHFVGF